MKTRWTLKEHLYRCGVHNTHALLRQFGDSGRDIAISYQRAPYGRMGFATCNETRVWSPSFKTELNGPYYNHGAKTFIGNKADSMPLALAWAAEKYGIAEWASDPLNVNVKVPAYVRQRAEAWLANLKKRETV